MSERTDIEGKNKIPPLEDLAHELHIIKHELFEGLMTNFKGFTNQYERERVDRIEDRRLLVKIHEATLEGQHDKRITKLETFCESNANLRDIINILLNRINVLESKAADTDTFKTSVKTTVEVIKSVGIVQMVAIIIGVTAAIIKFIILK